MGHGRPNRECHGWNRRRTLYNDPGRSNPDAVLRGDYPTRRHKCSSTKTGIGMGEVDDLDNGSNLRGRQAEIRLLRSPINKWLSDGRQARIRVEGWRGRTSCKESCDGRRPDEALQPSQGDGDTAGRHCPWMQLQLPSGHTIADCGVDVYTGSGV